jgi:hypothetical protein
MTVIVVEPLVGPGGARFPARPGIPSRVKARGPLPGRAVASPVSPGSAQCLNDDDNIGGKLIADAKDHIIAGRTNEGLCPSRSPALTIQSPQFASVPALRPRRRGGRRALRAGRFATRDVGVPRQGKCRTCETQLHISLERAAPVQSTT